MNLIKPKKNRGRPAKPINRRISARRKANKIGKDRWNRLKRRIRTEKTNYFKHQPGRDLTKNPIEMTENCDHCRALHWKQEMGSVCLRQQLTIFQ